MHNNTPTVNADPSIRSGGTLTLALLFVISILVFALRLALGSLLLLS